MNPKKYHFKSTENAQGMRLDRFLAQEITSHSRSQIKTLIQEGWVKSLGTALKPSYLIKGTEEITLEIPELEKLDTLAEDIPIDVIYEDQDIIVVNKAANLVVHPAAGVSRGTLVNALLHHCQDLSGIGGVLRPGIVHRLDKGTSGVLIVAKTDAAHHSLAAQFHDRKVEKKYLALVWGTPRDLNGVIESSLGRSVTDRKKISSHTKHARSAKTYYKRLKTWGNISLLELQPVTGRTHQIRVHLAEFGHPVLADPVYGKGQRQIASLNQELQNMLANSPYQYLHASSLKITHPRTLEEMLFVAPMREEIQTFIDIMDKC